MNFIKAIQYAAIGNCIRRKAWEKSARLWMLDPQSPKPTFLWRAGGRLECFIGGPSDLDLDIEDVAATDWEVA